jgi:hypothetical protein
MCKENKPKASPRDAFDNWRKDKILIFFDH